jgi:hypothetical protein
VFFFFHLSFSLSLSRSKLSRLGRDASLSLISAFFVCLLINKPHTLFEKSRFAFCRKKSREESEGALFFYFFFRGVLLLLKLLRVCKAERPHKKRG